MRIGIELRPIIHGESGGLTPLMLGLLNTLFRHWPEHEPFLFCTPRNRRLFPSLPHHVHVFELPVEGYYPLLDAHASHLALDVLVCCYPFDADLEFPRARHVVMIPDLQHEYYPSFFAEETLRERRSSFAKVLGEAGSIVTLSEHARQTLVDHPATRCRNILLVSPALCNHDLGGDGGELAASELALLPRGAFFLFPANLWPHKNHRRLLQAFARFLKSTSQPFELILTGHPCGWEDLARDFPGLPVRHLGFVRRRLLDALLGHARALVYFSLFEGFGMPLLEAFHFGVPVACSNVTSLPEIGGKAVLACDPTDVDAMAATLSRIAEDQALRTRLVAQGRERLRHYTWQDSAAQLVAACRWVCKEAPPMTNITLPTVHRLNRMVLELDTALRQAQADQVAKQQVIDKLTDRFALPSWRSILSRRFWLARGGASPQRTA